MPRRNVAVIGAFVMAAAVLADCAVNDVEPSDASSMDSSANDASTDAHQDVKTPNEVSTEASSCPSNLSCERCGSFAPTPQSKPLGPHTNQCGSSDISAFVSACNVDASAPPCLSWESSELTPNPSCLNCLVTPNTNSRWGVLVFDSTEYVVNSGGCVDLLTNETGFENSTSNGSCGDLVNASLGCQRYACGLCAPTDMPTCLASAKTNECASYVAAVANTSGPCVAFASEAGSPTLAACLYPDASAGDLTSIANTFCGN